MTVLCEFPWSDGWAPDHVCVREFRHSGNHRCQCDATVSDWMIRFGMTALQAEAAESAEEDRIRLREELRAAQEQGD